MNPDNRLMEMIRLERRALEAAARAEEAALKGGGGGGTPGGMEGRVAKLEADVDHLKRVADRMDTRLERHTELLAAIDERTKHLPTKPYIFACVGATIAAIGVIVALIVRFLPHAS